MNKLFVSGKRFMKNTSSKGGRAGISLLIMIVVAPVASAESMQGLVREALSQHPAYAAQLHRLEASRDNVEAAKWQFWPTPSISISGVRPGDDPLYVGDKLVKTLRLQQPLWTGGRLTANLNKAQARVLAQELEGDLTAQHLTLRVLQAWSDLMSAQGAFKVYQQSKEFHVRLLGMVQRRFDEASSAKADLELAQSRLDTALADLQSSRARLAVAVSRLEALIGRPLNIREGELLEAQGLPYIPEHSELLAKALEYSPQIAKAKVSVQLSELEVDAAKAAMMPELSVRLERQFGSFTAANHSSENIVFLDLTSSFGAGLSSLSAVSGAKAAVHASEQDVQEQRLALIEQVNADRSLLNVSIERKSLLAKSLKASVAVSQSWERQFLAGRKQWQDLMNSAKEEAVTGAQLSEAEASVFLASWRLAILAQGPSAVLGGVNNGI